MEKSQECVFCSQSFPVASMDMTGLGLRCADCTLQAEIRILEDNNASYGEHLTEAEIDEVVPKEIEEAQIRRIVSGAAVIFLVCALLGMPGVIVLLLENGWSVGLVVALAIAVSTQGCCIALLVWIGKGATAERPVLEGPLGLLISVVGILVVAMFIWFLLMATILGGGFNSDMRKFLVFTFRCLGYLFRQLGLNLQGKLVRPAREL